MNVTQQGCGSTPRYNETLTMSYAIASFQTALRCCFLIHLKVLQWLLHLAIHFVALHNITGTIQWRHGRKG